jgi:hypothetical protein
MQRVRVFGDVKCKHLEVRLMTYALVSIGQGVLFDRGGPF